MDLPSRNRPLTVLIGGVVVQDEVGLIQRELLQASASGLSASLVRVLFISLFHRLTGVTNLT